MYSSLSLIGYNSELIKQSQLSTLTSFIVPLLTFFRGGGEIPFGTFGCFDPHHLNKLNAYHPPTGISPFKGLFRFGHLPRVSEDCFGVWCFESSQNAAIAWAWLKAAPIIRTDGSARPACSVATFAAPAAITGNASVDRWTFELCQCDVLDHRGYLVRCTATPRWVG